MSTNALRNAMNSTVEAVENGALGETASNAVADIHQGDIKDDLRRNKDKAVSTVSNAMHKVRDTGEHMLAQAEDVYSSVRDQSRDYAKAARRYTREHPATAVLALAAIAGAAVTWLFLRRRD